MTHTTYGTLFRISSLERRKPVVPYSGTGAPVSYHLQYGSADIRNRLAGWKRRFLRSNITQRHVLYGCGYHLQLSYMALFAFQRCTACRAPPLPSRRPASPRAPQPREAWLARQSRQAVASRQQLDRTRLRRCWEEGVRLGGPSLASAEDEVANPVNVI